MTTQTPPTAEQIAERIERVLKARTTMPHPVYGGGFTLTALELAEEIVPLYPVAEEGPRDPGARHGCTVGLRFATLQLNVETARGTRASGIFWSVITATLALWNLAEGQAVGGWVLVGITVLQIIGAARGHHDLKIARAELDAFDLDAELEGRS
ncbi:MAG: hypothetical protein CVT66_06165 [Actinobacteria bacterium HGW-Actinobacteria-6]|nr:MAG: hypothetical protein CVT66_06165 [Actinobacteria bacterium HGW-Actinobacteria-6]